MATKRIPFNERLRLYGEAKKALPPMSAKEYEKAIKALSNKFKI
jgi:hypothetical protein